MSRAPSSASAVPQREQWTGQVGFILAAIGSAVGLGNIWRFPGVAYESGGGAFLIPYLVALLTAGIPILFLDYAIGHRGRGSAPLALRRIAGKFGEGIGWFQVAITAVIAIYYTGVLAWAASYFVFSFNEKWGEDTTGFFVSDYLQMPTDGSVFTLDFVPGVLIPLVIMWVAVLLILGAGVVKGVQRANIIIIPLLAVTFLALVIRALFLPGALDGLTAFFTPDFSALANPGVWIAAYGQVFFSLSIAFGIMITYASYRRRKSNMTGAGLVVAFGNSSFEILAGIGVFATLGFFAFTHGTTVDQLEGLTGVGLAFMTFPAIVSEMPGGGWAGALFFGTLVLAGLTSLISILEVVIAALRDKFALSRIQAVASVGVLALLSVVLLGTTTGLIALDTIDQWSNNIGIVASAVVMSVVVIWVKGKGGELAAHLNTVSTFRVGRAWIFFTGILAPAVLAYILIARIVDLIQNGYEGYPGWYLGIAGWGIVALMLVAAIVLPLVRWRHDPDNFDAWPSTASLDVKGGRR
ncbi:sodium-dependent transporter [Microbacterium amylolyticum]|uniref:NSS family neurotransmitter:Na+ symporter n=1 Tax=Microbacterium amylolyticum TaxID=936337 RepID=A0ABS4ZH10_9MICO|nr:sodium-dependent transporter [Microbacterium amylolyticum]MBP2436565.1 NSS family neurotransmitter:Na+ symporter [Microbacterium amylolyticum]